jgi:lambda family phage portal protein
MLKPAKRKSIRGQLALGLKGLAGTVQRGAMALGGFAVGGSGYEGARKSSRRTSGWRAGVGSAAADILPDLETLRGRSRDLQRNHPLAHGAIGTKTNGVVGTGLTLRSVIDGKVLGIDDPVQLTELQYTIEREWELFERTVDFTGQQHFKDLQRTIYGSARVSGDIGVARRYRLRPGDVYGTKIVLIEADRISNPNRRVDTDAIQGGVSLGADGEVTGWNISDHHPGDARGTALKWSFVPRLGPATGTTQMVLAAQLERPGQVRGVPLFAPIIETLKQMGDYTDAELKAALNDAYLFAFEKPPAEIDDEGNRIVTNPEAADAESELTLEDLTVTTLAPGADVTVKKPERPNTAFDGFISAMARYVGAALDLPYEVLVMEFGASFSASRGALEIAFKGFQVDQAWLIRSVLDPVREWQFTEMVARAAASMRRGFSTTRSSAWPGSAASGSGRRGSRSTPPSRPRLTRSMCSNGTKTREQVMTERTGGDFDTKAARSCASRRFWAAVRRRRQAATLGDGQQPEDDPNAQPDDQPDDGNGKDAAP